MDSAWANTLKKTVKDTIKNVRKELGNSGDAKFFNTTKKGEVVELKNELNSPNKQVVKEAVKKVIADMTVGKDVSSLFTDVVKSIATDQLELKKLVYLYIINYARSQPDKAILVVNTFQRDASSLSPIIRALAIRTMGCIRVDRIVEYLAEPLQRALKDKDPYVRKTAAIGVAKLNDLTPDLVEEQHFLEQLRNLISDPNPMVVANAVAALQDIAVSTGKDVFRLDPQLVRKLLSALGECTEWGQVFILDALGSYIPQSSTEAEDIVERVSPRLKHANAAVVMSAVKVIFAYLPTVERSTPKLAEQLIQDKLPPPLITLLSEQRPEIQYVALRNISLLVARQPLLLQNAVKHFFCKYNDPIYVKMEKLEILMALSSTKNVDKVLLELKEYATEVDVEFVRKAVQLIGRIAIKIDSSAERCVKILMELIKTKVQYVVQEGIVVMRDIFRKYPNRYESIIQQLCEALESLDEPDAKSALIWIIGEYADRIDNAPELITSFVQSWDEEQATVQLQLLTAVVKLFLKRPDDAKDLVAKVLQTATSEADNPDLRDRAYIYWRLLATDPEQAQRIVLSGKPQISDESFQMEPEMLDVLIRQINTLSAVYHKPPEFFVKDAKQTNDANVDDDEEEDDDDEGEEQDDDDEGEEEEEGDTSSSTRVSSPQSATVDLLGLMNNVNISNGPPPSAQPAMQQDDFANVLTTEQGLSISTRVAKRNGQLFLDMYLHNQTSQILSQWAIKFNENFAGVQPASPLTAGTINPGERKPFSLPLIVNKAPVYNSMSSLQVAIKTEIGVFYWTQLFFAYHLFETLVISDSEYPALWKSLPEDATVSLPASGRFVSTADAIRSRYALHSVHTVTSRRTPNGADVLFSSLRFSTQSVLCDTRLDPFTGPPHVTVKSNNASVSACVAHALIHLLDV